MKARSALLEGAAIFVGGLVACGFQAVAMMGTSTQVFANDTPIARLVDLQGNVLVSHDRSIASAVEEMPLPLGSRVVVTANSAAVVEYSDSCRVDLGAGDRFDVRATPPCEQLARATETR